MQQQTRVDEKNEIKLIKSVYVNKDYNSLSFKQSIIVPFINKYSRHVHVLSNPVYSFLVKEKVGGKTKC